MKTTRLMAAFCLALTMSACGADAPTESGSQLAATGSSDTVKVAVTYKYENAKPRMVNGRPVLDHKYWACVDGLTLTFAKPMRLGTVLGKVLLTGSYNARRAPTLKTISADYKTFGYAFGPESQCDDRQNMTRLTVSKDVRGVDGQGLSRDFDFDLQYPAPRDTLPGGSQAGTAAPVAAAAWGSGPAGASCVPGDATKCITVTPERLNAAMRALRDWMKSEPASGVYHGGSLQLLPLDYLMKPYAEPNRKRQYGSPDLIYVLRRAARFTQVLFPDLKTIPIADLSEADGSTPHVDDIPLHPEGSHTNGRDADVSLITVGSGNDAGAAYHYERNFWFLYAVLQSTGVDLVMTAYKEDFQAMAQQAMKKGLITGIAVGRFNGLQQSNELNHDKHFHIAVSNADNDHASRKFTDADDVYACYLGLRPEYTGGNHNYCGGL